MPNWKAIEKLRDHMVALRTTKHRKFDMQPYIKIISGDFKPGDVVKVRQLRKNGPMCGSVDCLAGETVITQSRVDFPIRLSTIYGSDELAGDPVAIHSEAERLLGLTETESDHMFMGSWSYKGRRDITRRETIAYLNAVLRLKEVRLYRFYGNKEWEVLDTLYA